MLSPSTLLLQKVEHDVHVYYSSRTSLLAHHNKTVSWEVRKTANYLTVYQLSRRLTCDSHRYATTPAVISNMSSSNLLVRTGLKTVAHKAN